MKLVTRIFERTDYYITCSYGERINPVTHKKQFHYGCDYGTHGKNWEQYALESGKVINVGYNANGLGHYVSIRYDRLDIKVVCGHLKEVYVKKNQNVTHETIIGLTGKSGQATGVHLDLRYKKGNSGYLDPAKYDYIPPSDLINPTERKYFMNQIEVLRDKLHERKSPSLKGEIIGYAKIGIYDYSEVVEADGYKWYKIGANNWIAYVEGYSKVYPTGDIIDETKKHLADALKLLDSI